ncbi:UPF0758 domain-containing protein [Pajaroellobacter abortibovis]|nr:UPF0758 domain-containing protein [Pajaroellobacter abortibovis]
MTAATSFAGPSKRALHLGAEGLGDPELIAILLGTGHPHMSV